MKSMHVEPTGLGDEAGASPLEPLLYNVVYCSRATQGLDASGIDRIVASAQRHNPAHGITGMLVFGGGIFFQWLEGPGDNVRALMAKLHTDPRHEAIVPLSETEEIRERLFPDWAMEHVTPDHIREVLVDAMESAQDERHARVLQHLLQELDSGSLQQLQA